MEEDRAYEELRVGFTAAVSHELRTPLARLLVLLEGIQRKPQDAVELAGKAAREVEEMRELVDDVLFLSELESGYEVVTLSPTLAATVLAQVVESHSERASLAGVTLRSELDPRVVLPLRPRMIRVIADNLVANAIRHAGDGATFTLTLAANGRRLELIGRDDGPGVSEEELPRLFERFFRAESSRTTRGSGLGLAIVKHVVVAAGGQVVAERPESGGLEIRCEFPDQLRSGVTTL